MSRLEKGQFYELRVNGTEMHGPFIYLDSNLNQHRFKTFNGDRYFPRKITKTRKYSQRELKQIISNFREKASWLEKELSQPKCTKIEPPENIIRTISNQRNKGHYGPWFEHPDW